MAIRTRHRILLAAVATATALTVSAEGFLREIQRRSLPVSLHSTLRVADDPSTMLYRDSLSLSVAGASIADAASDAALVPQCGSGRFSLGLQAESHLLLDDASAVWGNAAFSTGRIRDQRLCNSLDYPLVAPYVLGDSVGGDIAFRRYDFGGGYTRRFRGGWAIGSHLGYRAEIGWRSVDPRIRTVVSDLRAAVGASYALPRRRYVGLTGSIRSYSQQCDLDFYNPLNDIDTYLLTGLGSHYKRFEGNTNKNSGHSGFGYGVSARLVSADGLGMQGSLGFTSVRMNLYLRNFNNICPAFTDTRTADLYLTYGARLSRGLRFQPSLRAVASLRNGTENLFGTAAGASYDKIGSRPGYESRMLAATIDLPLQITLRRGFLTVAPTVGFFACDESLKTADLRVSETRFTPGLRADYSLISADRWLWAVGGGCSADSDRTEVSADASASRLIGRIVASLSVGYSSASYADRGHARQLTSTISITF